jgi:hypothetical protein
MEIEDQCVHGRIEHADLRHAIVGADAHEIGMGEEWVAGSQQKPDALRERAMAQLHQDIVAHRHHPVRAGKHLGQLAMRFLDDKKELRALLAISLVERFAERGHHIGVAQPVGRDDHIVVLTGPREGHDIAVIIYRHRPLP